MRRMSSEGLGSEVGAYRTTGLKEKKSERIVESVERARQLAVWVPEF